MHKFSKKRGIALPEYALIAVFFGLVLGIAIFQTSPDLIKNFFVRSVEDGTSGLSGDTIKLRSLGE